MLEGRHPKSPASRGPKTDATMKPDKKKWVHGEVRRQQIFDEAIDIIGQRGYRGFTLQELSFPIKPKDYAKAAKEACPS